MTNKQKHSNHQKQRNTNKKNKNTNKENSDMVKQPEQENPEAKVCTGLKQSGQPSQSATQNAQLNSPEQIMTDQQYKPFKIQKQQAMYADQHVKSLMQNAPRQNTKGFSNDTSQVSQVILSQKEKELSMLKQMLAEQDKMMKHEASNFVNQGSQIVPSNMNLYVSSSENSQCSVDMYKHHQHPQNPELRDNSEFSVNKISSTLLEFGSKSDGGSLRLAKNRFGKDKQYHSRSTSKGSIFSLNKTRGQKMRARSFNSTDMISSISFETPLSYEEINNQSFEIFQNYQDDLDFMQVTQNKPLTNHDESKTKKIMNLQEQINENIQDLQQYTNYDDNQHNLQGIQDLESTFKTFKQQISQYQESPERMKAHVSIVQTLKKDKQKIHDNIAHCLFCIYNQQDITHYFSEMMEITDLMRNHYQSYLNIAAENETHFNTAQSSVAATFSVLAQIQNQIQSLTSPKMLKGMVSEIVGDIMDNIRKQILQKMKSLDVIVKEPLNRRASYDDYNLCFENFNKKSSMFTYSETVQHCDQNGNTYLRSASSIFTNNPNIHRNHPISDNKNLRSQQYEYDDESSSSSFMSQSQYQIVSNGKPINMSSGPQNNSSGDSTQADVQNNYFGSMNLAFKQQQELYLDSERNYQYLRQEGKIATWMEIKQHRRRLHHFVNRPNEYKVVFDMILRSYIQLRDSLEYLEEFWIHIIESIYGKIQTGKLQFDRIWKDLFHQKIMENKYIKHFMNDVSDQYEHLQTLQQNGGAQIDDKHQGLNSTTINNKIIIEDIYQSIVKLETDLNQEYIIEDLIRLQTIIDQHQNNKAAVNQTEADVDQSSQIEKVISHQYDLLGAKMRLKYGGKSLAQLLDQSRQKKKDISQSKLLQTILKYISNDYSVDLLNMMDQIQPSTEQKVQTSSQGVQTGTAANKQSASKKVSRSDKKKKKLNQAINQELEQNQIVDQPVPTDIFTQILLNKPAKAQTNKFKSKINMQSDKLMSLQLQNEEQQEEVDPAQKQLEKKKKMNQKKKRQRIEKKKRQMIEDQNNIYQYIDDQQLLELVHRYDSQMSAIDQEYLLQVENREAVVRTLQSKIIERDQMGIDANGDEFYNDEDVNETQVLFGEHSIMMEDDREKLGLCHKNLQMQHNVRQDSCHSKHSDDKESTEERIYDSEFEEQLQSLKQKLSSIQTEDNQRQSQSSRLTRKLIPNVSSEWINRLKKKLKDYRYHSSNKDINYKSKGVVLPACLTTSTAGMSFNSPPATDREILYYEAEYADEEEECENYYNVDCEPNLFKSQHNKQRCSYMNIQNYESSEKHLAQTNADEHDKQIQNKKNTKQIEGQRNLALNAQTLSA